jgi:hypothetical protein
MRRTHFGIHLVEFRREFLEYFVYHHADRPQRMIMAYPLLRRNVAKNMSLLLIGSSHAQ